MTIAFSLTQAKELVQKVGLEPLFEEYLGSQKKHLCKCPCGKEFFLLFSTINRRLKENPNYKIRCKKCSDENKETKYTAEKVIELFLKHKAKPLFSKEFWKDQINTLTHKEFGRIHLEYECMCGKKDWTILENLIMKSNKNPEYVLYCHSCALRNGKQSLRKLTQMRVWIKEYFSKYNLKVENLEEIKKNTSKIIFYCKCGNIHQTTWMSLQQCQNEPKCTQCQMRDKPRGEFHPNWNPSLTEEERDKSDKHTIHVWSQLLRIIYEFKCQITKEVCNQLNCHHLKPFKFYPELRYDLSNGIPINKTFHEEFHTKYGRHSDNYLDFLRFFKEKTGRDFSPIINIVPLLIDNCNLNLQNMKKSFSLRGIEFIPIFKGEAIFKTNIIASMIKSRFGLITNKLNARDLVVKEIFDTKRIAFFLVENHRQSEVPSIVNIGLETKSGELVAVMTFGEPRFSSEAKFELLRYCCKLNTIIHGAAQKMFAFFIEKFKPESIISYADLRYSSLDPTKSVYSHLGFNFLRTSSPNYWYTKDCIILESRQKYQKHKLKEVLPIFNEYLSEEENMKNNGFFKISDCGNNVFLWKNPL